MKKLLSKLTRKQKQVIPLVILLIVGTVGGVIAFRFWVSNAGHWGIIQPSSLKG